MNLITVEIFKLLTQRAVRIVIVVAIGLSLVGQILQVLAEHLRDPAIPGVFARPGFQEQLFSIGGGTLVVMILAVLASTGEYRHKTISWSFLATPDRKRLVGGKLGASLIVAVAYGAALAILVTVGAVVLLSLENTPLAVSGATVWGGYAKDLAAYALTSAFAFGLGALVANQMAAIVAVFVEPVVSQIVTLLIPSIGRFLPSQAVTAFQNEAAVLSPAQLSPNMGAAVLIGYCVVLLLLAVLFTNRRDIA